MSWFGLEEINEFAKKVCDDFAKSFPSSLQSVDKPHARKQLAAALVGVDINIGRFLASHRRPGVIKKAKCANEVKWGLKDRGFQADLIDVVTQKVIHGLSRTPSGTGAKSGSR